MGDESAELVAYLPASLLRAVAAHPKRGLPWCDAVEGTMVMADLSGFTALSERLAMLGDEGAERLTEVINSFFATMLKTAFAHGGHALTFGGDAILLLFDGAEHATRAVAASLAMLKQVGRAAAVDSGDGKVKIGMSVGAHSDTFLLAAAGLEEERAHLFVLGRGAELTALAEAEAERGELAVSSATRDLLPSGSTLTPTGGFWRVEELSACVLPRVAAERPRVSQRQLRRLAPFLPPYARTGAGNGGGRARPEPEHRRTVIVFVDILGLNEIIENAGVDAALGQLQAYSAMLTRLAAKHQGFVVSSDIAMQGSKLVITFGTPVAHEHAPTNAARFALDLTEGLERSGLGLQHKIGLNGGHVFAGEVGLALRRQYTVMGDAVNLAARLMSAAGPGEALISRKLLDYASPDLCARELAPITVKGKEEPVGLCVLEEERRAGGQVTGSATAGPRQSRLFGRRAELQVIRRAWQRARSGRGQTVVIEGEPGVGKTRLLEEALVEATGASARSGAAPSGRVTRAACFEHLKAAPFTPWMEALQAVFAISRDDPVARRSGIVQAFLRERLAGWVEFGSLLNPLLGVSLSQSQVVGSLDARTRRQKLFELIARVLSDVADEGGHVIVIEDVHWMDDSSLALAGYLADHIAGSPILLLLTSRPVETPSDLIDAKLTRVALAELSETESLAMVREALDIADLPTAIGEAIYAKSRGNPLFLEEVVHSLQASGVLARILGASSVARAAELAALEIPDRVQGLLMSRIDRLPPDTREVLKAGSVVGRSFDAEVLGGINDPLLRPVSLERTFDELVTAALVAPGAEDGGRAVTFRHALLQDVAYESMPFARRRLLHGQVARYLEATQASPDHGLLVHHFRHAGDAVKTRLHAVRASESSVAVYANLEAVDYLAVALETTTGRTPRDACLRSRFHELQGDSLETLALYDEAVAAFSQARRPWGSSTVKAVADSALAELSPIDDPGGRDSLLCWKIAVATERGRAAYDRALRWLDKGAAVLPAGRPGLTARLQITRGGFLSRVGRFREAVDVGEEGVALARRDGDAGLQAYGLTLLGVAFDGLGSLERSLACHAEAVQLYEKGGDLHGLAMSHGNLADSHFFLGNLRAALEHDELSLALHARIGSASWIAREHGNLGATLLQMGDTDAAIEHLNEALALRSCQDVNPVVIGMALVFLCQAHLCTGDIEAAVREVAEGRRVLEGIGSRGLLLDVGIAEAELHEARGQLDEAAGDCRWVLAEARSIGAELNEIQALCALGRVRVAQGAPEDAIAGLEAALALAEKIGAGYERARTLAVLAEARASCGEAAEGCDDALLQAIRMFKKMGARYDLGKAEALRERLQLSV